MMEMAAFPETKLLNIEMSIWHFVPSEDSGKPAYSCNLGWGYKTFFFILNSVKCEIYSADQYQQF